MTVPSLLRWLLIYGSGTLATLYLRGCISGYLKLSGACRPLLAFNEVGKFLRLLLGTPSLSIENSWNADINLARIWTLLTRDGLAETMGWRKLYSRA
jgi:hypothetical protein